MKYIKKFNEELDSRTYRNAAGKLDYYNKTSRASKLLDFADERDFGFFNMNWGNANNALIADKMSFTQPTLKGIYYCDAGKVKQENNSLGYGKNAEMMAEELVENWKNGNSGLCITYEFSLKATRETLNNLRKKGSVSNFTYSATSQNPTMVIPFLLELTLSEWYGGVVEWDEDARYDAEQAGEEFTPSTIASLYEWTRTSNIYLQQPESGRFGVFSDRKSAIKFKTWLIKNQLEDKIKDSIMNVLRIVGGTSDNIEDAIDEFTKISIQGLYDDEILGGGVNLKQRWFDKQL